MFRQASVSDLITGRVKRADGHIVVAMRTYPRPLRKELRDEYIARLAPELELFRDFKDAERRLGDHDGAFAAVNYEGRFSLAASGMSELERLGRLAESKDVWLVCQCDVGRRCHRELLLLIARRALGVEAEDPRQDYPAFLARLASAGSILDGRMRRYP